MGLMTLVCFVTDYGFECFLGILVGLGVSDLCVTDFGVLSS